MCLCASELQQNSGPVQFVSCLKSSAAGPSVQTFLKDPRSASLSRGEFVTVCVGEELPQTLLEPLDRISERLSRLSGVCVVRLEESPAVTVTRARYIHCYFQTTL